MKWLTFLSIVYPLMSGAMLLVWAPEDRKIRNDYIMRVVLITSGVVIATVLTTWFQGSDATELHVLRMSQKLELAFRLDGPSMLFGLIIGVLWPVTTLYAFSYMEHEGHENKFFAFCAHSYCRSSAHAHRQTDRNPRKAIPPIRPKRCLQHCPWNMTTSPAQADLILFSTATIWTGRVPTPLLS